MNKSFSTYYECIKECLKTENFKVLFISDNDAYFRNVLTFLKMFDTKFVINKSSRYIKFENNSKMFFYDPSKELRGGEFNIVVYSETNYNTNE